MKKILNLLSFVILCAHMSIAQDPTYPEGEFYDIVEENITYFEQLKESTSEEEFNSEGGEYKRYQQWLSFWEPRVSGHGDFNKYHLAIKDYYTVVKPPVRGKANTDTWDEIGPTRRSDLIGVGPVFRISPFKPNPEFMLLSANSSGIFFSNDEGESWTNAGTDTDWPRSTANDVAFHPTNAYIWFGCSATRLGSGSYAGTNGIQYLGGVFRKGGSGVPWTNIADYNAFGGNLGLTVNKLLFDEKLNTNSDYTLFAATTNGLYRSDNVNSGTPTWSTSAITAPASILTNNPGYTFGTDPEVYDLEYQQISTSSTVFASMKFRGTNGSTNIERWRVMVSYDDGLTWAELPGQTSGYDPDLGFITLEVSPADADKVWCLVNILHACQDAYTTGSKVCNSVTYPLDGHITEYSLTGTSWTTRVTQVNDSFGEGNSFAIDQVNATELAVGRGLGSARYTIIGGASISFSSTLHADHREFVYHPTNADILWGGNDGGISKSSDGGLSWVDKTVDLGVAQIDDIADSKLSPDHLATAIYHNHCGVTSVDYTGVTPWDPDWDNFSWGDGTAVMIDPVDEDVIYGSSQGGGWQRLDGGPGSSGTSIGLSTQWWTQGEANAKLANAIYRSGSFDGEQEIHRSFNKGTTNDVVSDFKNSSFNVYTAASGVEMIRIIKSSPVNQNHLYTVVRTHDWRYRLLFNPDINNADPAVVINSWIELPLPRVDIWISGIAFDENNSNIVYISYSHSTGGIPNPNLDAEGLVYRMDYTNLTSYPAASGLGFNCGSYPCDDISMNLPNTFADFKALVYEKGSNKGIYLATDFGLYYTNATRELNFDPGIPSDPDDFTNTNGWIKLGNGLPHVNPRGLLINYSINRLRIGTDSRGIWEHDLQCPDDYDNLTETGTYSADEWIEVTNNIQSDAVVPIGITITYRAGNEIRLKPGFEAQEGCHFHAFIHGCDRSGNSFKLADEEYEIDENNDNLVTVLDDQKKVTVFPNPSAGKFSVRFELMDENSRLSIFNLQGQNLGVNIKNSGQHEVSFDISDQPPGVYILNLVHKGEVYVQKIILQ